MTLCFEKLDEQELNVALRDLSSHENLDVKELFANYKKEESERKKKKKSKADMIKAANSKRLSNVEKERDVERLEYFEELSNIDSGTLDEIMHFKTRYGKDRMKMKLLDIAFSKNKRSYMINLYLQLLSDKYESKRETKLMKRVTKEMDRIDYKRMQFETLSNELSPLDFYNEHKKELDTWQIDVLKNIDKGKSTLVCAPTSCGKTWLSIYPGITGKKVLFVVPTPALVYQVSALFVKFGASVSIITADFTYSNINDNVFVGTPKDIEDKLPAIGLSFDIVIYDEIHNLSNSIFGNHYERLVKILKNTQFLALSATIGNPNKLRKWFEEVSNRSVSLITYTTRFLNLQRHLFMNNSLTKIHPISCLTNDDITSDFLLKNLPMTPYDCVVLYDALQKKFKVGLNKLDVKDVFVEDNKRLSLDDARKYETLLKEELIRLKSEHPSKIEELLKDYAIKGYSITESINLYSLFKEIKNKNLTPCIVFQQNTVYCKEIFIKLVGYLEKLETLNYPYHYENLEYAEECYRDAISEKAKYKSSIKFDSDFVGNKAHAIEDMLTKKWEALTTEFLKKWEKNYTRQCNQIRRNSDVNEKVKQVQMKNLLSEYNKFTQNISLKHVDVFQKHSDFCLNTSSPMTANKIRDIRNTIRKKLSISVAYTNVFMQGLKRGIGIYTTDMPPIYNMIVQQLAQTGTLGYVIADVSLALGINMPFRSSCILGYKDSTDFQIDNYLQMIGRSGRRGMDREGHIIYANVNWTGLMKGELGEIESPYKNINNYSILGKLNDDFKDITQSVYSNILDSNTAKVIKKEEHYYDSYTQNILLWKMRDYNEKIIDFINNLMKLEMSCKIEVNSDSRLQLSKYLVTSFICDEDDKFMIYVKDILKFNKLPNDDYECLKTFQKYLLLIKNIHNVLEGDEDDYYKFTCVHLKDLFNTYKNIILQANILN